jgi:transforming growth factor-beta-induced protein
LADALAAPDANITLFAPVNSAIPQTLAENLDETVDMLLYHIVHPSFSIDDFEDGQLLESGLNLESLGDKPQRIQVFRKNEHISLNWHVKVESLSIQASNGWIHLVDSILKPPSTLPSHLKYFPFKFSMLSIALRKTGVALILNEINGVTFFAPTNSAFLKLGWLKLRHLFSDDGVSELASVILCLHLQFRSYCII